MNYKECGYCQEVMQSTSVCCPNCGIDRDFKPVSNGLIGQSARLRDMIEAIHLGGSMSGWDSSTTDEIQSILDKSK